MNSNHYLDDDEMSGINALKGITPNTIVTSSDQSSSDNWISEVIQELEYRHWRRTMNTSKETGNNPPVINEDISKFILNLRRELYSGQRMTFKEFLKKTENLLDEL